MSYLPGAARIDPYTVQLAAANMLAATKLVVVVNTLSAVSHE